LTVERGRIWRHNDYCNEIQLKNCYCRGKMSLNPNLSLWLKNALEISSFDGCGLDSDEDICLEVGKYILGLPSVATMEDVYNEVSIIFNCEVVEFSLVVEYMLVHAVSEQCQNRSDFVTGIMSLEPEAQMFLMQVIQDNINASASRREEVQNEGDEEKLNESSDDVQLPVNEVDSPVRHSVEKAEDGEQKYANECYVCAEKNMQLKKLQQDIAIQSGRQRDEILKLKDEINAVNNKVVDLELAVLEKDDAIFQRDKTLEEQMVHKEKLDLMVEQNAKLEEQLMLLQDEVDVLKPLAAKLDQAESQVDRYRSKLDELSDIKQQLKVESSKHAETYDKLVVLEQEAEGLRKFKPLMEEYRHQSAEAAIVTQELQMRLQDKEAEVARLLQEASALRGDQTDHRQQTQLLAEELRTTAEELRERERTNGIGEGMSELNPALMQELNRLKAENKDLYEKLDQTALATLEVQKKEIADQQCVNSSLQKKWMATKDSLAKAVSDIQSLTFRLHDKETEYLALKLQFAEASAMSSEEVSGLKVQHAADKQFCLRKHKDAVELIHRGHNEVMGIYNSSLAAAHAALESTQAEVVDLTALQQETAQELEETKEHLQEAGRKRKHLEMAHEEQVGQLAQEHAVRLQEKEADAAAKMCAMQEKFKGVLDKEQQKFQELNVELELEVNKRRKVERQKKFAEAEVQRQKTQLMVAGVNGTGAGNGIDVVLVELKSMQQQLDEAHSEIVALRSKGSSGSGTETADQAAGSASAAAASSSSSSSTRVSSARALRSAAVGGGGRAAGTGDADGSSSSMNPSFAGLNYSSYLEQSEVADKRIEQLTREKREMLSKSLEETKEKNEISQKLLMMEKENATLQAELRKVQLDKERNERKLMKQLESYSNKENVIN
jgi:hypothetical protein